MQVHYGKDEENIYIDYIDPTHKLKIAQEKVTKL